MTAGQMLMQYPIGLPADYDMNVIRERVRTRGSALDDRAGLNLKAYCVRERDVDGSSVNAYAPVYLWDDVGAAARFLWEGVGFEGIVRDFGRPTVRTWVPAALATGPAAGAEVTHAVLRTEQLDGRVDLVTAAREMAERAAARAADLRVHRAVAGIDPTSWSSVEFHTLAGPPDRADGDVMTVLHVSEPGALRAAR